ncbi:TonB-dependent hemoglobin/transferrin/lactoferrin family receptor [Rhizobium sp. BK376]|uniref:TonB-dependent hemoglobin/transferrin/lactoferrin family receptor n=1 Tax=Rhizobium sp. BK376 TaxID=2512149 RepID=UPI001047A0D8|nr:TonB-dependent hemoglobin/transferrin/lactoferrin family receptor [Rhizobium sp. BK376]TCR92097.1 hemoglobin/transferrin/lactoferrin receptor protein [Rhizobium sp. BK376]
MVVRRSRSVLLACTAFLALGTVSFAQQAGSTTKTDAGDNKDATTLQKIVVKGARPKKDPVADTPLASQTTADEINNKQINRIEDLGRSTELGVGFDRTSGSVNIRGLEDDRVLTTIDGIPIPYMLDGARGADGGINSFNFNTLSTVDVVRGADSSRAGGGALGGALVLRTLEPEDLIDPGKTWGGVFKLDYNGDDRSFGGSAAIAKRIDNTAVLFQGGYTKGHELESNGDVGGYGATRTEANPADYNSRNYLFKLRQYTDGAGTFGLTAEHYDKDQTTDLKSAQSLTGNYRPGQDSGSEDIKRDRVSLDYNFESTDDDSLFDTANAVFYWQRLLREDGQDAYRYTSVIGDYWRRNTMEDRTFGFNGNASKSFDTGTLHHKVTFGLDASFTKTTQYSAGDDSCGPGPFSPFSTCSFLHTNQSDMPDVDGKKIGGFIDDKIALGDSRFSLTPGLRFDWYDYTPKNTQAYQDSSNYNGLEPGQSDNRFSPKLRASFEPQNDMEFYAQWAMAFRAPNVTELYENYGVPGGYLSIGNPDLKPETSNGIEVGANLGDQDFGGHLGVFYNRYKNFIDTYSVPDTTGTYPLGITEYFNRANVRIYGFEANAHKTFNNGIHINGAFAYANGRDMDTGEYVNSVAPAKGSIGVGYATDTWGTDVTFIAAARDFDKSGNTYRVPGYGIVDLTGWWQPEKLKGLRVNAGVYNVFDQTYYDALNTQGTLSQAREFYSEPGRTFKISLVQRF